MCINVCVRVCAKGIAKKSDIEITCILNHGMCTMDVIPPTLHCNLNSGNRANICTANTTMTNAWREEGSLEARHTEPKTEAFNEIALDTLLIMYSAFTHILYHMSVRTHYSIL